MALDKSWIDLKKSGKRFGRNWIFSRLNLTIQPGESVALFGNNGCGKSTLLRIIAMLTPLTTGRLKLFGQEPLNVKNSLRRKLSFLSHEKRLYSALSVAENMRLVANIQGIPGEALIDEALTQLNLMRHKQKKVRELSEGMRKRLVLARLVLRDAQLILLDEPYPSLDKESRQILDDLIKGWREDGKVILHASHDHDLALVHANRLLILEQGKLEYDGSPK